MIALFVAVNLLTTRAQQDNYVSVFYGMSKKQSATEILKYQNMEFKINKTSSKKIKQAGELFPQSADVFVSLCSSNMTGKTLNFSIQFCYCKIKVL